MSFVVKQNIQDLVRTSQSILIPLPESQWRTLMGSALAIASVLKSTGKEVTILTPAGVDYTWIDFLDTQQVTSVLDGLCEAKISIDTSACPISELKYTKTNNSLDIYLTPEFRNLTSDLVTISQGKYQYDLILALECMNWEDLGSVFQENPQLFQETPALAISASGQPKIGKEQWIDWEYSSVAEMIYAWMKDSYQDQLSKEVVTGLLLGLITETDNFQSSDTSSRSFLAASELLTRGADQETIIRVLYKTKPLRILKLLGRLMAHLEFAPVTHAGKEYQLAYSKLYQHDFEKTETSQDDIPAIIRELQDHIPSNCIGIHVMIETGTKIKQGIIDVTKDIDFLSQELDAQIVSGRIHYTYPTEGDIHEACDEINAKILDKI